jgi:hypothetical protein
MQFKCYAHPENELIDAAEFVAFRADNKYVMGVLPSGDERLLLSPVHCEPCPERPKRNILTLKAIEQCVPGILRASRDVLVVGTAAIEVVGEIHQRSVRTVAGEYRLSRRQDFKSFELACAENALRRATEQLAHRACRMSSSQPRAYHAA